MIFLFQVSVLSANTCEAPSTCYFSLLARCKMRKFNIFLRFEALTTHEVAHIRKVFYLI